MVTILAGQVLATTKDLKTSACTAGGKPHARIIDIINKIPNEVNEKFYGCGAPLPMVYLRALLLLTSSALQGLKSETEQRHPASAFQCITHHACQLARSPQGVCQGLCLGEAELDLDTLLGDHPLPTSPHFLDTERSNDFHTAPPSHKYVPLSASDGSSQNLRHLASTLRRRSVQGYLTHKKNPPPLGPP